MDTKTVIHWGETPQERAARRQIHVSCLENRDFAICGNGNYHALLTRNKAIVNCEACLKKLEN